MKPMIQSKLLMKNNKQTNYVFYDSFFDLIDFFEYATFILDPMFGTSLSGLLRYLDQHIKHFMIFYFNDDKTLVRDLSNIKSFKRFLVSKFSPPILISGKQPMNNHKLIAYCNKNMPNRFVNLRAGFTTCFNVKNIRMKNNFNRYNKDYQFLQNYKHNHIIDLFAGSNRSISHSTVYTLSTQKLHKLKRIKKGKKL